ncbi:hypothetical protein [Streptomyces sp. DSM 15324]|uniref:hypothetical protein n=1 Tax=Streptomyces sp. DSM 15324 TaxID=1739111 RepID=UPI00074903E3|nr:hypothetical protein AQJ58_27045 [Streptomyces sp. DSM 15324]
MLRRDGRTQVVRAGVADIGTAGYTQLMAATPDGRRSLTFSVTRQINADLTPALPARMRALQEDFVCGLMRGRG